MMLTMWENLAAAEGGRDQDFKTPEPNPDAFPFVKLPSEIRNMVYKDLVSAGSLGWQSVIERLSKLQAQRTPRKKDRKPECHSTSAILLVNRQIHMEAIQVLYSTVFELPFPVNIKTMKRFFCKGVFEQIRYVTFIIDIDKEESQIMDSIFSFKEQELEGTWLEMIKFLPLLWSEQHSLRHLRVIITTNRSLRSSIFSQPVRRRIMAFSTLRGIEQVSIEQKERVEVPRHRLPRVVYLLAQLDEL